MTVKSFIVQAPGMNMDVKDCFILQNTLHNDRQKRCTLVPQELKFLKLKIGTMILLIQTLLKMTLLKTLISATLHICFLLFQVVSFIS
jgi:hypothetical protein